MNTLAYIKLNRITGEEIDHGKRNAWLFVRVDEGESQVDAIAMMRLFSSICEAEGFHIIGESVFIGNETGAEHFLKAFVTRVPFVDCIVTPSIHTIADNYRDALTVVEKLQAEDVELVHKRVSAVLEYFEENRECSILLLNNNSESNFAERIFDLPEIGDLLDVTLADFKDQRKKEAVRSFTIFGSQRLLQEWVNQDEHVSPEQEAAVILELARRVCLPPQGENKT